MKKTLRFLGLAFVIVAMVLTLSLTVFADDSTESTPTKGYTLYIYNADGTVGMDIDGTKSASDFSLKSAIEDARTFVDNAFLFGIQTPVTYVIDMHEDSYEDESFEIGADVTINGNGFSVVKADGVEITVADGATLNNVNGLETVKAVAEVNGVQYETLAEALDAAQNSETVKVLCDVVLADPAEGYAAILVNPTTKAVLDLNGFTVSYETSVAGNALMQNCGTLEIVNGTITFKYVGAPDTNYSKGNYTISNQGKLTVGNGATILNTTAKMSHACYTIDNNTCASSQGAELIVNDGATIINENNYAVRQFAGGTAGNRVTVNGGIVKGTRAVWMQAAGSDTTAAPIIELTVNGGTLEATGESADYKLAVYSYSYGNSLANSKVAISGGTIKGDIALTGGMNKTTAETVVISGGVFEGKYGDVYSYADDETAKKTITVTGGTFTSNYPEMFAVGYKFVANSNGTYSPEAQLPTADVNNLGQIVITDYKIYDLVGGTGLKDGTTPIAIPVTMQFTAKDSEDTAAKHPYKDYLAEYYITINGPEGELVDTRGCYLAGNYDPFGWIIIPLDGLNGDIHYNTPYPVISFAGFQFTYEDICTTVKDFKCGMILSETVIDYLAAEGYENPITLDLGLSETIEDVADANYEKVSQTTYTADQLTVKVAKIGKTYYETYAEAFAAAKAGDKVEILVNGEFEPTVSEGLTAIKNFDGDYVVGVKPTATVNNLGAMYLPAGEYVTFQGGTNTIDRPLSFVMQFLANESAEEGTNSAYANWYADFVISIEGLENNFVANGCYMAGYYDFFGSWAVIPLDGTTIENGGRYPVMLSLAGNGQDYRFICESVRDFKCALYLTPEILEANPNLKVTLELNVVDSSNEVKAVESLLAKESEYRYVSATKDYVAEEFEVTVEDFVAEVDGIKYGSLETAIADANGNTVKLLKNVTITSPIVINKGETVVIDLAGCVLTYNSTTMGEAMITNRGTLTINDTVGNGEIYYNYTGESDPSYGKGNYTISNGGTLTVNGGKIHIANLRSHAKYPIDNNSTSGDAILEINGGHLYNYNTSAIRQFCNSTTNQNSVTINGGKIEGYCAIWVQNPGKNTVNGKLTITGGEIKSTAAAYVNGTSDLKDVSSRIYFTIAGVGGAWSESSSIAITGGTINENVNLAENTPADYTIGEATFNGYVKLPANYVAEVDGVGYTTLAEAIANANGKTVKILENINLASERLTIKAGNTVTIDLNGFIVSGTCDEGQDHMIMVENTAKLVICDSSDAQTGKLTYAQGASNVGWTIDLEGELVLESGTIELTGDSWSIGYAVDVRPNAWGTAYTAGTVFTMNGGKVVSSDGAIRVASSSSDTYASVSASFIMKGGEIEAEWDGIFVQQSNATYDILNVQINAGKITSSLAPIRFYGPAKTSTVGNVENPMTLAINGGTFVCDGDESRTWIIPNVIVIGGGVTVDQVLAETSFTKSTNVTLVAPDGYEWSTADGVDTLVEVTYVAEVEGVGYTTLAEAIANANEKTVTLLNNIALDSAIVIEAGKTVTLDLNGKTVTMVTADDKVTSLILNKGNLTVKDSGVNGKLSYHYTGSKSDDAFNTIESAPSSILTIESGIIENLSTCLIAYAVDGLTNGNGGDVTVNINGGTLTSKKIAVRIFANSTTNTGYLNISGGEIFGRVIIQNASAKANKAALNISGGIFNSNGYKADVLYVGGSNGSTGDITAVVSNGVFNGEIESSINAGFITGGTFANDVTEFCVDGFVAKQNENGTYGIVEATYVAEVDGVGYTTLQDAINAANNKTVVILEDIALADGIVVSKGTTVTIELNGKTISRDTELTTSTAAITNNGNLTIQDTIGGGKITAFAKNPDTASVPYYANNTITNGGTLTILGGTIENSTSDDARAAFPIDNNSTNGDAIVYIKGGVITGRGAIRQFANSTTYANKIVISGGEIIGTSYAIWTQNPGSKDPLASFEISNGTVGKILMSPSAGFTASITGGTIKEIAIWSADTTNPERNPSGFVSGGTFLTDVSDFCANGYECVANQDGTYGIEEKEEVPQIEKIQASVEITSDIKMNFFILKTYLVDGVNYYVKLEKVHNDNCAEETETYIIPMDKWSEDGTGNFYQVTLTNLAAKELNCDIKIAVYAEEAEENVLVSKEYKVSVESYAIALIRNELAKTEDEIDKNLVTLLVDLLNYGAAAQKYFHHYENEHLANANIDEYQQYASNNINYEQAFVKVSGDYCNTINVELENTIYLNFWFKNLNNLGTDYDPSKLTAIITYTDALTEKETSYTLTSDSFIFSEDMSGLRVPVKTLTPGNVDTVVQCVLQYNDVEISTMSANITFYCKAQSKATDDNLKTLVENLKKYATSAYVYFSNK